MKIILEQDKCIGCGACAALDEKNFCMKGHKAEIVEGKEESGKIFEKDAEYTNDMQDACDSCPVQCIILKKE